MFSVALCQISVSMGWARRVSTRTQAQLMWKMRLENGKIVPEGVAVLTSKQIILKPGAPICF